MRPDGPDTILCPLDNVGATSLPELLPELPVRREGEMASSEDGTTCLEASAEAASRSCSSLFVMSLRSTPGDCSAVASAVEASSDSMPCTSAGCVTCENKPGSVRIDLAELLLR
jgi:hypothetical protein